MSTAQDNRNQVVLSAQELRSHYHFRLNQAGFSSHRAANLASLMLEIPTHLTQAEQALVEQAITALEHRKVPAAPQVHCLPSGRRAPKAAKTPRHTAAFSKSYKLETHLRPIASSLDSSAH